ncbi:hypothetical protein Tco_0415142 [Tanacetum coccineum]
MELVLEQTQQGTSYEVSVSAEGVEELKRKVKIKGEKKEALLTLRQKPEHQSDTQVITMKIEILLEPTSNKLMVVCFETFRILKDGGEAPGPSNVVARHVIDDLINFSGETAVLKYMKFFIVQQIAKGRRFVSHMRDEAQTARSFIAQLNAVIAKMEVMEDREEVYDSLMSLRDARRGENNKLMALNDLIAEAEEEIETKEAHVEIMDAVSNGF